MAGKKEKRVISFALGVAGLIIIALYSDPLVAVGVFIVMWGDNIDKGI